MSIHQVVPLIETQMEAAAQVLALALQDDPLAVYILPDAQERKQRFPGFFMLNIRMAICLVKYSRRLAIRKE